MNAALLLLAVACRAAAPAPAAPKAEKVRFKTSDGWALTAKYLAPPKGGPVAVLTHGVGASKEEWEPLETELAKRGFGTLAVDLRGHGESQKGEVAWSKATEDLIAASRWLKTRGVAPEKVGFAGGSIGANLSARAAALVDGKWAALLSPGVDYRGVSCPPVTRPTFAAASPADAYAYRTAQLLSSKGATFVEAKGGHGAQMLIQPDFLKALGDWIEAAAKAPAPKPAQRKK